MSWLFQFQSNTNLVTYLRGDPNWPVDVPFSTQTALQQHPEAVDEKSVILDLAYEEFHSRKDAGEKFDVKNFVSQFPRFRKSLIRLLSIERYLHRKQIDWPQIGQTFLGFRLHDELGRGSFSRVFMASEIALGNRKVVVKVCHGGDREAYALGKLQHPNIGPILSVQHDKPQALTAICMPFLTAATLYDVLDAACAEREFPEQAQFIVDAISRANGARQPNDADLEFDSVMHAGSYSEGICRVAIQLAEALAHTHRHGILHCDIKPSNVLLSPTGDAILFDFNLSFQESAEQGNIGGTVPYMAPELLELIAAEELPEIPPIDPRTDLFSLGVTLYELLSGRLPFEKSADDLPRGELAQHLIEQQKCGPTPLHEINPNVDRRLAGLVERCLAFDPYDRPDSANAIADELKPLLAESRRRVTRPTKKRRNATLFAVATIAIMLAIWFTNLFPSIETRAQRAIDNMHARSYAEARDDLVVVAREVNDGPTYAYLSYCLCKLAAVDSPNQADHLRQAIRYGEYAIERGFHTPAVHNNLGYCFRELQQFDKAYEYLNAAIETDPKCLAAGTNLMKTDIESVRNTNQNPPSTGFKVLARLSLDSLDYHTDMARFYAQRGRHSMNNDSSNRFRFVGATTDFAIKAMKHGAKSQLLDELGETYPAIKDNHLRFDQIRSTRAVKPRISTPLTIDPLQSATGLSIDLVEAVTSTR